LAESIVSEMIYNVLSKLLNLSIYPYLTTPDKVSLLCYWCIITGSAVALHCCKAHNNDQ